MELIFVYIRKYKIFENQGFCFSPEYEISCEESNESLLSIKITKKKNVLKLFEDDNANISVICGKNGCGKSTLLEAIASNDYRNVVLLYKNKTDNFFATEKISIKFENQRKTLNEKNILQENPSCHLTQSNFSLKNIVEYYSENPNVFDGILSENDKLFTHFQVKIWNLEELVSKIKVEDDLDFVATDIQDYDFQENPFILYAFLNDTVTNEFSSILQKSKIDGDNRSLFEFFNDYISIYSNKYKKIIDAQDEIFQRAYRISNLYGVKAKIKDLEELYSEVLKKVFGADDSRINFDSLVYYDGVATFEDSERHVENLSSGELQEFKYRYQLFNVLKDSKINTVLVDEPEANLHPEWCRRFIYDFLKSLKAVKEILGVERKITFIISTHSPFVLSDITNEHIVYLERQADGSTKQVKKEKDTFAGNIGELFTENFFMGNTIGEFARSKIQSVIEKLRSDSSVSDEELKNCKQLIDKIGDDLLKTLLTDMWKRKYEEN